MRELLATNNRVTISFVEALLDSAEIDYLILDQNMSILEGSLGIIPCRVMVDSGKWRIAVNLMRDAGVDNELKQEHRSIL